MSFIRNFFGKMSLDEWYFEDLKYARSIIDKKLDRHKKVHISDFNAILKKLIKSMSEVSNITERQYSKNFYVQYLRFIQTLDEHKFPNDIDLQSALDAIDIELSLYSQQKEIIGIYFSLLKLKIGLKYFSSIDSLPEGVDLHQISIQFDNLFKSFSALGSSKKVDFSILFSKFRDINELESNSSELESNSKMKLYAEIFPLVDRLFVEFCRCYNIQGEAKEVKG